MGFSVWNLGVQDLGSSIQGPGFRVQDLGSWIYCPVFGVQDSGTRI